MVRAGLGVALVLVATFSSSFALAAGPKDEVDACLSAAVDAQKATRAGRYVEARSHLATCRRSVCPPVVRQDCATWTAQVDAAIPTVVFATVDEHGADVPRVAVEVDGQPLTSFVPGRATELDPGNHEIRATAPDHEPALATVTVRETEKGRIVQLELRRAMKTVETPPPRVRSSGGPPTVSWVLAGSAAALGVTGAVLGALASREHDALSDRCGGPSPSCSADDTASGRRLALGADVAFGLAAIAGVAAIVTWIVAPDDDGRAARAPGLVRF